MLRPPDLKWMLQGRGQVSDNVQQTAAQGLSDEQRCPDYGNVEEQVNGEFACSGWLGQL